MNGFNKLRFYFIDILRGTDVLRQLSLLQRQQYLSKGELQDIVISKMKILIDNARSSVPYYKQFEHSPTFPELTKDIIRRQTNDFISQSYKGKLIKKTTGGSTGIPLMYYTTPQAQSFMWAGIIHAWKIVGYELGDKVAFITGTALAKKDWRHQVFYRLMNIDIISAYDLSESKIETYIKKLITAKTKIIYGYPTAIHELALYILKHTKIKFPDLKGIVVTSEVLENKHKANIEAAFKVVVRNQYGCNEAGISAFECEFGNLHLINTAGNFRIDENGTLFSTNMVNEGFYFINYNTGDKVTISDGQKCSCRRGYPVIEEVKGRAVDLIVDQAGKKIHSAFFSILFRTDQSVEQFQVQFDNHTIQIALKVDTSIFNREKKNEYLKIIKKAMLFDYYTIKVNQPFLISTNAKHKYIIDKRLQNNTHANLV